MNSSQIGWAKLAELLRAQPCGGAAVYNQGLPGHKGGLAVIGQEVNRTGNFMRLANAPVHRAARQVLQAGLHIAVLHVIAQHRCIDRAGQDGIDA
jgi:hypothetical protein